MPDPASMPPLLLPRVRRFVPMNGRGAVGPVRENLVPAGMITDSRGNREAYRLQIDATGVTIAGQSPLAILHARATLAQLERQYGPHPPGCLIEDGPAFPTRGVMLDISRDRVPTNEHFAEIVDRLAALKFNHLQLYTEHTFAYQGHEDVWANASPMTPAEVRGLDRYCRDRGIELAANQNCFGHLASWLRHPKYAHLAETHGEWTFENAGRSFKRSGPFSLCPLDPGSIELVRDLLSQLLPCFEGPLVNIGCDETFDIGSGRSKDEVARRGRPAVYFDFVRQVVAEAAHHDRRSMMWADIALSHPESIHLIPEGVIGLAWGYEPDAAFGEWVTRLRKAGREAWVCPGTSAWRSITGRTSERRANLLRAAREGVESGATGYLVTEWGDMGHRQQWPITLHALAEAADAAWTGGQNGFDPRATSLHVLGDRSLTIGPWIDALGDADLELRNVSGPSTPDGSPTPRRNASALFTDLHRPFEGEPGPGAAEQWDRARNRLHYLKLQPLPNVSQQVDAELSHTIRVATLAASQAVARRRGANRLEWLALAKEASLVAGEHRVLWLRRSRPGGMNASGRHYDAVATAFQKQGTAAVPGPEPALVSNPRPPPTRLIAGCMTGTSIDSLDAALIRTHGRGLSIKAELVRTLTRPLGDLTPRLRALAEQQPMTAGQIAALSRDFSLLHLAALRDLLAGDRADLIAVHGQTVFHSPPVSWQMLTPAVIAHGLGIPVVSDLRAADLAHRGQGAPITPIVDWLLFSGHQLGFTVVVNLGGFCNITLLPPPPTVLGSGESLTSCSLASSYSGVKPAIREPAPDEAIQAMAQIVGMDVCGCNHLLDGVARKLLGAPFDADGARAAAGEVHSGALEDLGGILAGQQQSGRSLGTGDELGAWINRWSAKAQPQDMAATACEAIGQRIAKAVQGAHLVLLAGGGARNKTLVAAITSCCSARVDTTDAFGIPSDYREAVAMAVLGALCQDRVAITLTQVTGALGPAPIAGTWVLP